MFSFINIVRKTLTPLHRTCRKKHNPCHILTLNSISPQGLRRYLYAPVVLVLEGSLISWKVGRLLNLCSLNYPKKMELRKPAYNHILNNYM